MRKINKKILSYSVFYQADPEGGFVAFVPSLPGCHSQGDSLEETEKNVREAIEVYLESLIIHKESVPQEERSFFGEIRVSIAV